MPRASFLSGVAEGAVAGGVEVGGVYGIDFAFEVVGENEGFVGHFGNGDADVVSGGLRFFPMDGLRSGGLLCFLPLCPLAHPVCMRRPQMKNRNNCFMVNYLYLIHVFSYESNRG